MAKMMGPRFKQCRRLGLNVCGHPKAMKRATKGTARNDKKLSQKRKFKMLFSCGLSFKKIKSFDSEYSKYIVSTLSTFDNDEFETFVDNFRNGGIIQNG